MLDEFGFEFAQPLELGDIALQAGEDHLGRGGFHGFGVGLDGGLLRDLARVEAPEGIEISVT